MSKTMVELLKKYSGTDLADLCDAAEDGIRAGGGFGWLTPPTRDIMESYWKGVLLVPERRLFVGRLENTIVGSAQLLRPGKNNEAQAHWATMTTHFVAPWARGHGLAKAILVAVEEAARELGAQVLNLDVRESQDVAIQLYQSLGYVHWGTHPHYAKVNGKSVAGLFFYKDLV